ncbi:putative DNA-binding transcriptional regulator YafY [Actinomadura coerulea]|uniref:Putative DNA-binding transcriptional regulator YafY n=1 Tax=Actinomadura coerulea TaxID=46159 RepID=A0A7X0G6F5_9ACTN|nr:WYL domain-containing protein [Actinomadura coerulea]MBB6399445.1 putative DNA-binding transcriptional regulator YafY [Actinomadura coerulea]GGQ45461.1 DNA-binding transcriptional regulator [Actinomadura coerulea]
MLETSARLLALLSLLQSRPSWPGSELAERLGVSGRTIRNDIARLRELGYPVDATRGTTGSYKLGVGTKLPPLLLDDQEAVAIAIGLRAGTGISGIQDSSARALAKLEQVLPHRLRRQVAAIHQSTSHGPENTGSNVEDPEIDPGVLTQIATAVRDHEWLRFDYTGADGQEGEPPSGTAATSGHKLVEPYRLVSWARRWYLVGRDPQAGTWATFRVDWITPRTPTHRVFAPTPLPGLDYTSFVLRDVASTGWKVHARITVFASAQEVLSRINAAVGVVESVNDQQCVLVTGADSLETIAVYIGMLGLDFEVTGPPGLIDHLAVLGERYLRSIGR